MSPASVRPLVESDRDWALALNQAHVVETGPLDPAGLDRLLAGACASLVAPPDLGFLIGLGPDTPVTGENIGWFKARGGAFAYVDRVIVAPQARGQGIARALYASFFAVSAQAGAGEVVCEYNLDPPNPASLAFHAALGFKPVGEALLTNGKTVRYMARSLAD
jgi:uncharacterized protein